MSAGVDTSRDVVEQLAIIAARQADDPGQSMSRAGHYRQTAATLRQLLAERDALAAELDQAVGCITDITAERDAALNDARDFERQSEIAYAERDAAISLAERHMNEKHKAQKQAHEDWEMLQQRLKDITTERDAALAAAMQARREALEEAAVMVECQKADARCWQWCECEGGCRAKDHYDEIAAAIRARGEGGSDGQP